MKVVIAALVAWLATGGWSELSMPRASDTLSPLLERYVAIGTSISMGWRADGITPSTQSDAWPSQLARAAGRDLSVADLRLGGCRSPILAPIALGLRLDGTAAMESAGGPSCSIRSAATPAIPMNVAVIGARTHDALATTPEIAIERHAALYRMVLPPGMTQVEAMVSQRPTFVSVELGANEVFGVYSGVVAADRTLLSASDWARDYDAVLARVRAVTDHAILVALIDSLDRLPGLRRGAELWRERDVLRLLFHVLVDPDCDSSRNLIFVPLVVSRAITQGIARRHANQSSAPLSCADRGGLDPDYVLTPMDETRVNAQLSLMNAHIRARADSLGFAHVGLDVIYTRAETRRPFSVLSMVLSPWPFGPLVSADGLHPSAMGARALAESAARAIVDRYGPVRADASDRLSAIPLEVRR